MLSTPISPHDLSLVNEHLIRGMNDLTSEIQANPALETILDLYFSVDVPTSVEGEVRTDEVNLVPDGRHRRVSFTELYSIGVIRKHSGI